MRAICDINNKADTKANIYTDLFRHGWKSSYIHYHENKVM